MYFLSLKIVFIIANSTDPGEISQFVPFHQGLYCLLKNLLWKKTYDVQPHEMYKMQNICNLQGYSSNCIVLEKMSAHPWKYWLSAYWFLQYCLVKSSIEIHECIFGHAAIHHSWLTQFHTAFLNSHQLDYSILVDFVVWIKCFASYINRLPKLLIYPWLPVLTGRFYPWPRSQPEKPSPQQCPNQPWEPILRNKKKKYLKNERKKKKKEKEKGANFANPPSEVSACWRAIIKTWLVVHNT